MRTHERVLAQIEADLAAGRWGLGEHLPAERALAEELGVSRPSVREAIRILEAMGIVRTAVGSGPTAGATVIDRPAAGLGAAVRLHVASGTLPVSDVVSTRVLLETWAMREVAGRVRRGEVTGEAAVGRGPDEALDEPRERLAAMEVPGLAAPAFLEHDQNFHLALVRLAGNQLVEAIATGMRAAVSAYVATGAERITSWPTTAARLSAEHRSILAAVEAGDADTAEKATREHIEGFYREAGLG